MQVQMVYGGEGRHVEAELRVIGVLPQRNLAHCHHLPHQGGALRPLQRVQVADVPPRGDQQMRVCCRLDRLEHDEILVLENDRALLFAFLDPAEEAVCHCATRVIGDAFPGLQHAKQVQEPSEEHRLGRLICRYRYPRVCKAE
eukprot:CAMPEP_0173191734 /NCGR_PEP_ID=MMETSP1141-20130122/13047_1 /TAXON_ID=483371 /ORGANISM="non described non described, Strain CCMP2298" /LENGTH=142 /DNA_ID=CAMNT_0014115951 /DNA_START=302 /DNA_END=730 /DNA_ORIENTATION=-